MTPGVGNELNSLFSGAQLQESLLQSYRRIQFTTQSVFLLIGTFSTYWIIYLESDSSLNYLIGLHLLLTGFALFTLFKIRKVIQARARDVDYWHAQILLAEQDQRFKDRSFTHFKIHQKLNRSLKKKEFTQLFSTNEALLTLVEKGKGHTRKVMDDQLMWGFVLLWTINWGFILFSKIL